MTGLSKTGAVRTTVILVGSSAVTGGTIWSLGGMGMKCSGALVAIGPMLVVGLSLSLQPFLLRCACDPHRRPWVPMIGAIGLPLIGASILQWKFCDPLIAVTLLILGPAIALGQSWGGGDG